ncbi:MAG TPA: hypothetical protein VKM72_17055 [Thermoanaerobaculia bacterium]|nr:hypothetical protein [Thermoanaerobaculia bacterium]
MSTNNTNPAGATQEPVLRKRVVRPDDQGRAVMAVTGKRGEERLKSERVQLRLKRLPGWKMQPGGNAIDRVRHLPDALSAAAYLAFAALLARQLGLPLQASVQGGRIGLALSGPSKSAAGITEEVLDLAEQLG